jgi:DNA-directed RNA polymerase specialized sigma24 family protein
MNVNELYDAWRGAEGDAREDLEAQLYKAVKTYAGRLMSKLKGENPPELADDIAGDVILGLPTFRGEAKFHTWAGRIALNKWND